MSIICKSAGLGGYPTINYPSWFSDGDTVVVFGGAHAQSYTMKMPPAGFSAGSCSDGVNLFTPLFFVHGQSTGIWGWVCQNVQNITGKAISLNMPMDPAGASSYAWMANALAFKNVGSYGVDGVATILPLGGGSFSTGLVHATSEIDAFAGFGFAAGTDLGHAPVPSPRAPGDPSTLTDQWSVIANTGIGGAYGYWSSWCAAIAGNGPGYYNLTMGEGGAVDGEFGIAIVAIRSGPSVVPAVDSDILGYLVGRPTSAQQALQPLCKAFFFDLVETDGSLIAKRRGSDPVADVAEDDLGLLADKSKLTATMVQEQDLPREVQVLFPDQTIDYQQNKVSKIRSSPLVQSRNQQIVELPIVIGTDYASQVAERALYLSYLERKNFQFNTFRASYMQLDPADVITFTYNGVQYQGRIIKTSAGSGWTMEISLASDDSDAYVSQAVGDSGSGFQPSGGQPVAIATSFWLFDIPLLQDSDANAGGTGIYFALYGATGWPGGVLYESPDDTTADFTQESSSAIPTTVGTATNTLGAPSSPWAWDTVNTLTVTISGTFSSSTEAALLAGADNALLVGSEVLQFRDCVDNGDGTWTFSHLLRGRRGTDWACGSHGASETVVYLSGGGMVHVDLSNAALSKIRYYRGVTLGGDISAVASKTITPSGVDLKPYSPVAIGGSADASGNITIVWKRRTRYGGSYGTGSETLIDGVGGPVNEDVEKFEIDILNGASVVRTLTTYTNTTVYTAAQQTADFGSLQATVNVKIYQISATVDRGYPGAGAAPATTDAVAEAIETQSGFYINGA